MPWITITSNDVASYQAGGYVEAFETAALLSGQANPLAEAISAAVAKIRGYIKAGGYSVDRDTSKIPASLRADALALVVAMAKNRIAQDLTDAEKTAQANAIQLLRDIAQGKFDVEVPENPEAAGATTQSSAGVSIVRPAKSTPKLSDFNGL
ncbi:MAG: DUF1320 family protein [Opitutales bacterium]|nr:DUF1320 family protein [Opitutales bacterium]